MSLRIKINPTDWGGRPQATVMNGIEPMLFLYTTTENIVMGWSHFGCSTFDIKPMDAERFLNRLLSGFAMFTVHELEEAA